MPIDPRIPDSDSLLPGPSGDEFRDPDDPGKPDVPDQTALPVKHSGKSRGGENVRRGENHVELRVAPEPGKTPEVKGVVRLEAPVREKAGEAPRAGRPVAARQVIGALEKDEPVSGWQADEGESREWGKASAPGSMRWMVYWGLGVFGLLIAAFVLKPVLIRQETTVREERTMRMEETAADVDDSDPSLVLGSRGREVFSSYVRAASPAEAVPFVRDGEKLRGILEKEWSPAGFPAGWEADMKTDLRVFQNEGVTYGVISVRLPGSPSYTAYLMPVGDRVLVDWEASTARGTATFGELGRGEGDGSLIRAVIARADHYTFAFPEREYQSYLLASMDSNQVTWGYTRRGGEADEEIGKLFRRGAILSAVQNDYRVCLRLERGSADSLPNQWLIGELLHIDWVQP